MNRNYLGLNFRQRAARRRVVVVAYLSCCAIVIALAAGSRPGMDLLKLLAFSPFVVMAVCWWILNQVGIAYTGSATHPLDERQEQVRNRAFFRSYQTICALTSLALLYWMIAATASTIVLWYPSTPGEYATLVLLLLYVSITLPPACIAWCEPDFLEDARPNDLPATQ
jgi:hypothetical protein